MHSYDREPLELELDLLLDGRLRADARDPRDRGRRGRAPAWRSSASERGVRFSVRGRDGRHRATTVTADRDCRPRRRGTARCASALALAPGGEADDHAALRALRGRRAGHTRRSERPAAAARAHRSTAWLERAHAVVTDDELFNRVLRRSLLDMRMLRSRLGGRRLLRGRRAVVRDAVRPRLADQRATQMLAFDPPMAEQTLRVLAGLIGTRDDPVHDEEPGKVLHELRTGEVARLGLTPLARYYGTVDATPLFLCLLCEHADWSGDLSLFRELRDAGRGDARLDRRARGSRR